MKLFKYPLLIACWLLIAATPLPTFKPVTVPRIDRDATVLLQAPEAGLLFITFFEPDCSWCLKQMQALDELQKNKMQYKVVAVGIQGSRFELKQWAARANTNLPIARITPQIGRQTGSPRVTPTTLVFDTKGNFVTKFVGFQAASDISKRIK